MSVAKKLSIALFINTSLITFIIKIILPGREKSYANLFGSGGLIYNQNYIFIMNIILPTILNLIFFEGWYKKIQIKL